ncbi:MAG: hypothetical protein EBT86_00590 [Actinobacteria bacterium]|nr:hypothetical protein [Actinomycetota bacterium]
MRIAYFPKQTAHQSEPIWQAFLNSCKYFGIYPVENSYDADCAVIWSVLWRGRLLSNKKVYEIYRSSNKPVFILEVGSLHRGSTWKVSVNNITKDGIYANEEDFIPNRFKKLNLSLTEYKSNPNRPILITGQHDQSLQWTYNGSCIDYIYEKIQEIRTISDVPIIIRPHPRNKILKNFGINTEIQIPIIIPNTYDQYDLDFNYRAVINFNSGVGIQAALHGVPIVCDQSSLASEVSVELKDLHSIPNIDRHHWFEKVLHSEWTLDEIDQGIPLARLLNKLNLTK